MRKYLAIVLLFLSIAMYAQKQSVRGTVVDQNGNPVIGLTVLEQGTRNGVTTDTEGKYHITIGGPDAVLEFSALGYVTVKEKVGGRAIVNVALAEESLVLDEERSYYSSFNSFY